MHLAAIPIAATIYAAANVADKVAQSRNYFFIYMQ